MAEFNLTSSEDGLLSHDPSNRPRLDEAEDGLHVIYKAQVENALRESEERFRLMADVVPVSLVLTQLRDSTLALCQ